ncbi:MAG: HupE/UreJ family protein [Leadbetterella sp.]
MDFITCIQLGFEHISAFSGYDHMLFLLALITGHSIKNYKKNLILVTAFTLGHSLALALSILKIIRFESEIIEFCIPVTICITAIFNIYVQIKKIKTSILWSTLLVVFFGLIHGCGFSNYLSSLLGKEASIFMPLLGFNLGLEMGQIAILACIATVILIITQLFKQLSNMYLNIGLCIGILILSGDLMVKTWPF